MGFKDFIGYQCIKNELSQVVDMFKNEEMYKKIGARFPKGILIYGAPGVGKTTLANAFISECGVNSYIIKKKGSNEVVIENIIKVFEDAKKDNKAIILIDDIDKFSEEEGNEIDDSIFVTIQACIDEVKDFDIMVIATANGIKKLPSSLLRQGRFDRKIHILPPVNEDSREITKYYLKSKNIDSNINIDDVVNMISYTSCAALESIINESAIIATFKRKEKVEIADIVEAYLKSKYHYLDEHQKRKDHVLEEAIYHEAGHVVVSEAIHSGSVGIVSVLYSEAFLGEGITQFCHKFTKQQEIILINLAGKAAVEMFFKGRCGRGCEDDIDKALELIKNTIMYSGTHGLSNIRVDVETSENYKNNIENIVHATIERSMFVVRDILMKNKDFFNAIVEKLREKTYLLKSDIEMISKNNIVYSRDIYF